MEEAGNKSQTLGVWDYLVIVAYFQFVLAVGLWVRMSNLFSEFYNILAGIMEIQEKQCWRILPRVSKHELCLGWSFSVRQQHWLRSLHWSGWNWSC